MSKREVFIFNFFLEQWARWSCHEAWESIIGMDWMGKDWGFNLETDISETSKKSCQVPCYIYQSEVQRSGPELRAKRAVGVQMIFGTMTGSEWREKGWSKD